MEPIIRNFKSDDVEEMIAMIEYTIEESYQWVYPKSVRECFKKQNSFEHIKDISEAGCILVAVHPNDSNKIIGVVMLLGNAIQGFFIHPLYHGNGIGTKLMKEIEDRVIANGLSKISLSASISSRNFFLKLSYKGTPKVEKLHDGTKYVLYDMEKYLS